MTSASTLEDGKRTNQTNGKQKERTNEVERGKQ